MTGLSLGLDMCGEFRPDQPFTPASIPNLELWLDATDAGTITLRDSTYVTAWNDKSGNGNNFTQTTEVEQPAVGTNEIDFSVSLVNMIAGSNYIFSTGSGLSIVFLARAPTLHNQSRFVFDFGLFSTSAGYGLSYDRDASIGYGPSGTFANNNISEDANYHRISGVYTFGDALRLYVDNVLGVTDPTVLASLTAANINESPTKVVGVSGPMTLGKESAGDLSSRAFDGHLKTLLIYSKALTAQERADIDTYLAGIP